MSDKPTPVHDEHLELQIQQKLTACEELSSTPIDIRANAGEITLSGEVHSFRRKLKAQDIANSCTGARTVINDLVVTHTEPLDDTDLAANVNENLLEDDRLIDQAIRVDAHDSVVTLSGYVKTDAGRDAAVDVATSTGGVLEVKSLLIVNPDRAIANLEHCHTILAAISGIIGMEKEKLTLCVVDETARVSGTVDDIWKKEAAEAAILEFGILNVCNEIEVKPLL